MNLISARGAAAAAAAVLLSLSVFYPLLNAGFVNFDDPGYVLENSHVPDPKPGVLFHPRTEVLSDWIPVTILSYSLDYAAAGFSAPVFHLSSILWHLASAVLLYLLLRELGLQRAGAGAACAVFVVHPLAAESVAWISGRKNILAALFGLAFTLRACRRRWVSAALFLFLALASKGEAVFLPLWPIAAALLLGPPPRDAVKSAAVPYAVFFALCTARAVISLNMQFNSVINKPSFYQSFFERMNISLRVFPVQLRQFILPYDLSFLYSWQPQDWLSLPVGAALCAAAAAAAVVAYSYRHDRMVCLFLCMTIAAYLPVSNISPAPFYQADRYMYFRLLPLAGLAGLLVERTAVLQHRTLFHALFAAWLLLLAGWTHQSVQRFSDTESLWLSTIQSDPNDFFAWNQLAFHYAKSGKAEEAERAFRRTLELYPREHSAHRNLVLLLQKEGKFQAAEQQLSAWLRQHPHNATAQGMLAKLYLNTGSPEKAAPYVEKLLASQPQNPAVRRLEDQLAEAMGERDD